MAEPVFVTSRQLPDCPPATIASVQSYGFQLVVLSNVVFDRISEPNVSLVPASLIQPTSFLPVLSTMVSLWPTHGTSASSMSKSTNAAPVATLSLMFGR